MRHDFATVAYLIVPAKAERAAFAAAVPPDSSLVVCSSAAAGVPLDAAEGEEVPPGLARLVASAARQAGEGHAVVLLSTDDVKTLAEAAELLGIAEQRVPDWTRIGWLDDYGTGDVHRIPAASIRRLQEIFAEEYLDLGSRRMPGWDLDTATCAWSSVVDALEAHIDVASEQLLVSLIEGGARLVARASSGLERVLPGQLARLLGAAAREGAAGHVVVLATVDDLIDLDEAVWYTSTNLAGVLVLVESASLDDYCFEGEHHIPRASAKAYEDLRTAVGRRVLAELRGQPLSAESRHG